MDAGTITIICAVLGSSALTTVIQAIVGAAQKKKTQADSQGDHLSEIDKKLDKMQKHQDEQDRSILSPKNRTEEMPMSERLKKNKKYVDLGGNGDVKPFLHHLEAQCERK